MVKKMNGGEMTKEQQEMLANLAAKGLKYGAKQFAKSDMGQELGGLASNALSSGFNWLFGNGQSGGVGVGGAKGDQRRFLANRAVPNRVPNSVRVREMNDVKNYNRNQQQRVFDMSKRQVQSESESIKPIDSKDAGAAFKLQTYISKLQQILGQKADLFSQIQASPFTDLNQLKGTTKQAGLLTMLTSKAEFVQAYNEMVAYVALFFKDIQLDNRVRDRMYAAYFQPLIDQMRQLSQQYPNIFATLPAPPARGPSAEFDSRQGKVYDLARKELRDMYSLLNVAADNIQDGIFRPIGPKDVAEYSRDNNVNATFSVNPPPPGPIIPSLASQQASQQINLSQQIGEANQRAALAQAAEIAAQNPYDPRGDPSLSPQQVAAYLQIQAQLADNGIGPRTTFPTMTAAQLRDEVAAGRMAPERGEQFFRQGLGLAILFGETTQPQIDAFVESRDEAGLVQITDGVIPQVQLYNDWITSRGVLAPPGDAPQPVSPRPQPGGAPAEPAREPARQVASASEAQIDDAVRRFAQQTGFPADERMPAQDSGAGNFGGERWRPLTRIRDGILKPQGLDATSAEIKRAIGRRNASIPKKTPGKKPKEQPQPGQAGPAQAPRPQFDSFGIDQNNSAEARAVISAILKAEEAKQGLLGNQSQEDAESALKILENDNRNAFDTIMASQGNDRALVRMDVILPMVAAINSAKRDAGRKDNRPEEDFVGMGMSGGRLRSHQNMRGRELDFVPAKALNSAAPPVSMGYGSQHRPKFAWELEQERAGPRYIRQDRQIYNANGGLGMVNPDAEIGMYQALRMAGEVGHRMSGGVYLPKEYIVQPAGEKEFFGYGVDGDNDVFGMEGGYGSLKRRLAGGMVNPFANDRDYHYKPKETGYDDAMDFAYGNHEEPLEGAQQAHEEEEEKPVDLDENPNPFRVRNENYKVNTGKMKKVSYKMPDK